MFSLVGVLKHNIVRCYSDLKLNILTRNHCTVKMLRFNLVKVEVCELRPEVVAESDEVLVHYQSRTNVRRGLSTKTLA